MDGNSTNMCFLLPCLQKLCEPESTNIKLLIIPIRLLARWAPRHPVDGHFLKKTFRFICCHDLYYLLMWIIVHLSRFHMHMLDVHFSNPSQEPAVTACFCFSTFLCCRVATLIPFRNCSTFEKSGLADQSWNFPETAQTFLKAILLTVVYVCLLTITPAVMWLAIQRTWFKLTYIYIQLCSMSKPT